MSVLEHWRVAMTPISPVHLGTGQDYQPSGYVIDDETLWEFDAIAAHGALPEAQHKRLSAILDGRADDSMLLQVQSFFYENRERLIGVSRHQVRVPRTVEGFYQERVGKVVQDEGRGSKVQNKLEIERTAWSTGTGKPILPGSGLKGAIRTALLNRENKGQPLPDHLKKDREASRKLQEDLFRGSFHMDPMRLIRLGDATVAESEFDFATEIRFAINRKKRKVLKNGKSLASRAEQANLYQLLECLPPWGVRAFEGSLAIQQSGDVESTEWPKMCFSLPVIAEACNRFYRAHLDRELAILKDMGYLQSSWADRLEGLLQGYVGRLLDANKAFLLRVGRHSGAESVTLNGVRNITIMKGRGERPDYLDSAKTLWLAGDEYQARGNLLPFGWLLAEPFRDTSDLAAWPEAIASNAARDWHRRTRERQEKQRERMEADRAAEETQRQAAEAAERKRSEEAARLTAMSPEERRIQDLQETLDHELKVGKGKLSPGGKAANDRVKLMRDAKEWESRWRVRAAEAIEKTLHHLPWSKKKRSKLSEDLKRLREPDNEL